MTRINFNNADNVVIEIILLKRKGFEQFLPFSKYISWFKRITKRIYMK